MFTSWVTAGGNLSPSPRQLSPDWG
jgi:hypothetical protein